MNFREQQKLNFKLKLLDHEYIRIRGKLREEIMATKALQQKLTKSSGWLEGASHTSMSTKRVTKRKSDPANESVRTVSQATGEKKFNANLLRFGHQSRVIIKCTPLNIEKNAKVWWQFWLHQDYRAFIVQV